MPKLYVLENPGVTLITGLKQQTHIEPEPRGVLSKPPPFKPFTILVNYKCALWERVNVLGSGVSSPTTHLPVGNQFNSLRFYHALGFATGHMAYFLLLLVVVCIEVFVTVTDGKSPLIPVEETFTFECEPLGSVSGTSRKKFKMV